MDPGEALELLRETLRGIDEVPHHETFGTLPEPPVTLVGAPALSFASYCDGPTDGRFIVFLLSPVVERAIEDLLDLLPVVVDALMAQTGVTVIRADPARWQSGVAGPNGAIALPCYEITVEVT